MVHEPQPAVQINASQTEDVVNALSRDLQFSMYARCGRVS